MNSAGAADPIPPALSFWNKLRRRVFTAAGETMKEETGLFVDKSIKYLQGVKTRLEALQKKEGQKNAD